MCATRTTWRIERMPATVLAVHHGEVAEATLAEDLEPLLHRVGHRHRDRVLGHDLFDLGGRRVDAVPDRAEEIALAEHAAQPALRIEHRCRSHIGAVQDHRGLRQGDAGRHDHRRLVHHIGDGQGCSHGLSLALCARDLGARIGRSRRAQPATVSVTIWRPHDRRHRTRRTTHRRHGSGGVPRGPRAAWPTGRPTTFATSNASRC